MTPDALREIREKAERVCKNGVLFEANDAWTLLETDIPALLAHIDALTAARGDWVLVPSAGEAEK